MLLATTMVYSGTIPITLWERLEYAIAMTVLLVIVANALTGLYNRVWQFASASTALVVLLSLSAALVLSSGLLMFWEIQLPLSVWYITWLTSMLTIGGSRYAWRMIRPHLQHRNGNGSRRVLIYGAGSEGMVIAQALANMPEGGFHIAGYIDDNPLKRGTVIGLAKVLGDGSELAELVQRHHIDEVIITIPSATRDQIKRIYMICREANVKAQALPPLLELLEDSQAAPHDVSVEDLLGRELSLVSIELYRDYISGKTILVTGAGGSIGSELCRQICRYGPRKLLLVGRGENRLHWIYLYLSQRYPNLEILPIVQSITETDSLREIFAEHQPEIVFHTAAHKHVYLMEKAPVEAVRNNVLGTARLADLAEEFRVERFIFISSDKAVAPSSVMGATKRVGELLLTLRPARGTQFICVRFGNVLGSEGSVLEIFKRQWARREPLTVTHPEATRYFMSIPEACFLVLQAGALGKNGNIFLLDMGEPINIRKLAEDFILLNGGNPHEPGVIVYNGLKTGEKLHEKLACHNEQLLATDDEHIFRVGSAQSDFSFGQLQDAMRDFSHSVQTNDPVLASRILQEITGGDLAIVKELAGRAKAPVPSRTP
jgi:FlaA1/EpsC-like NDP-sugar epimerase